MISSKVQIVIPKNCLELYNNGEGSDGVYVIKPDNEKEFEVRCDMTTSPGGWTVFQRRKDGSKNFYREWSEYENGFGSMNNEFWLGLDNIHRLSESGLNVLRVDIGDFDNKTAYAEYKHFSVAGASEDYKLTVGEYDGNAGDSLAYHNGMSFSTWDRGTSKTCAVNFVGAWWFNGCHHSHLNGKYLGPHSSAATAGGIDWMHWKFPNRYSLKTSEMKVLPLM